MARVGLMPPIHQCASGDWILPPVFKVAGPFGKNNECNDHIAGAGGKPLTWNNKSSFDN